MKTNIKRMSVLQKIIWTFIIMSLIIIFSHKTLGFSDICASDKSLYILYEDFESGVINDSVWDNYSSASVQNNIKYEGNYALRCIGYNVGICIESAYNLVNNDTGVLAYISADRQTDGSTFMTTYTTVLGRNYGNNFFQGEGSGVSGLYNYYDGSWKTLGIGHSYQNDTWDRVYFYPKTPPVMRINITNGSDYTIEQDYSPANALPVVLPMKLSVGSNVIADSQYAVYYDKIMIWNRTNYGDTCPQEPYPPNQSIIYVPNCSVDRNYTHYSNRSIQLNWTQSSGDVPVTYSIYFTDYDNMVQGDVVENTTELGYLWDNSYWNVNLYEGYWYFFVVSHNIVNDTYSNYSCPIYVCDNTYARVNKPCIDGLRLVEWSDTHNCNEQLSFPASNNSYEECTTTTYVTNTWSSDVILLGILFLFLIISTICAITVHEAFFGVNALIIGLMWIVFRIYNYPQITIFISVIMIACFSVMWVIVGRARR